jgi:hypothetical protein
MVEPSRTPPVPAPGGKRRTAAALVAGTCVAALLAGCGRPAAGVRVGLLPGAAARGQAWNWTARCQFGPSTAGACAPSGPVVGRAQLEGDEWNLGASDTTAGSVGMSVDTSGTLVVNGRLPSAPPCTSGACLAPSANTWVRGYPSVLYGTNQCHAATSPPASPKLPLPLAVRSLPSDLIGTTAYSAETSQVTYDVAYDMWLSKSGSKTPCTTDGTVEVMVWTDYDAEALLPATMQVGTASVPYAVNGVAHTGQDAWSIYASNIFPQGRTQPWGGTVWLVLNPADVVKDGTVSVDLTSALAGVGTLLQNDYGWTDFRDNYWLDTIPFGLEFGPQAQDSYGRGPANFSLNLSSYCLALGTTVAKAAC